MNKNTYKTNYIFLTVFMFGSLILFGSSPKPFTRHKIFAGKIVADTTSFKPNTAGGWGILASYMDQVSPDSVHFEIILKRTGRIDGKTDQLIGTITNVNFIPAKNQLVDYYLLIDNVWKIRITKDGECFLKQDRGSELKPSTLAGNPDVIPINIRYKKN